MKAVIIDSFFCIIESLIIYFFIDRSTNSKKSKNIFFSGIVFLILLLVDLSVTFFHIPIHFQISLFIISCELILELFYISDLRSKLLIPVITLLLIIMPSLFTVFIVSWVSNTDVTSLIDSNDNLKILTNTLSKLLQFAVINTAIFIRKKDNSNDIFRVNTRIYMLLIVIPVIGIVSVRENLIKGSINTSFSINITLAIIMVDLFAYLLIRYYTELNIKNMNIEMQNYTILQQQKDIENIMGEYYETLKIRHDIKKYLNIAIELSNEKEYEKLDSYLKSFQNNELGNIKTFVNTQNRMFNAIINQKLSLAENKNITINCCILDNLSDFKGMDDLELCIIFMNLLDNAIEAEASVTNPIIKLNIFSKAGYLCAKIDNIVEENILSQNPDLKTTKENKNIHGIGLKSVREIIERHDGIFNVRQDGEWFSVEIMLLKSNV